jgi:hypothetical protein
MQWTLVARRDKQASGGRSGGVLILAWTPPDDSNDFQHGPRQEDVVDLAEGQHAGVEVHCKERPAFTFALDNMYTSPSLQDSECIPRYRASGEARVLCWDSNGHHPAWDANKPLDERGRRVAEMLEAEGMDVANIPEIPTRPCWNSKQASSIRGQEGGSGKRPGTSPDLDAYRGVRVVNWGPAAPVGSDHIPRIFDVLPEATLSAQLDAIAAGAAGDAGGPGREDPGSGMDVDLGGGAAAHAPSASSGDTSGEAAGAGRPTARPGAPACRAAELEYNMRKLKVPQYRAQVERYMQQNPKPLPGKNFFREVAGDAAADDDDSEKQRDRPIFVIPAQGAGAVGNHSPLKKTRLARKKARAVEDAKKRLSWWARIALAAQVAWLHMAGAGRMVLAKAMPHQASNNQGEAEEAKRSRAVHAIRQKSPEARLYEPLPDVPWRTACEHHLRRESEYLIMALRVGRSNGAAPRGRTRKQKIFDERRPLL